MRRRPHPRGADEVGEVLLGRRHRVVQHRGDRVVGQRGPGGLVGRLRAATRERREVSPDRADDDGEHDERKDHDGDAGPEPHRGRQSLGPGSWEPRDVRSREARRAFGGVCAGEPRDGPAGRDPRPGQCRGDDGEHDERDDDGERPLAGARDLRLLSRHRRLRGHRQAPSPSWCVRLTLLTQMLVRDGCVRGDLGRCAHGCPTSSAR